MSDRGDDSPAHLGAFDYVVVGGGTAGCLLANRLSADAGITVLLIEAGQGRHFWHEIPIGYRHTIGKAATDWMFQTEPEPELDNRRIPFPRGRGLGGTSLINGMIYARGHRRDYDRWVAAGAAGWSWDEVLPFFKRTERYHAGASAAHGAAGEVDVVRQRASWPFLERMATGISGPLVPWADDFNAGEPEGIGYYEVTQRNGRRWDARRAFIDPIRNRPNLKILENALVEKVAFDGSRADTVIFTRSGERMSAKARGEVILAAGAILSPYVLERSGIGSPGVLKQAGIAPRVELPGVGENLQDHLQVRTIWRLSGVTTLNQQLGSWLGQLGMAMRYLVARSGPLTMAPAQLGIFARSRPDKEIPDLQYLVVPYSADRVGGAPHDFPGITMSVCQLDPASRGSVHVSPAQPAGSPVIRANYLSADEDRRVMIDAVRQTRRIMTLLSLADLAPAEVSPGPQVESDADILAFIRRTATTVFHPVGTCRMGTDDGAVVDPGLRVRGVEALRVVDASVMPLLPAANTGGPTMMIAEKAADLIRRDRVARAR